MDAIMQAAAAVILNLDNLGDNDEPLPHRQYNDRKDPFAMSDARFKKFFRLDKNMAREWINVLTPHMTEQTRLSALDIETKVLVALHFFASGSYQADVGASFFHNVSQPTVSRCIKEVINAANHPDVMREWIRFPQTYEELINLRNGFVNAFGIPAIGCIDCTHVAIVPPNAEDEDDPEYVYVNRKGFHSINVQLICDSKLRVLSVNARFPGSVHDSHIWNMCNARPAMEAIYRLWPRENFHLLGDSGYALRPWLITPYHNPPEDSPEAFFNSFQTRARNAIERCNGVFKMRYRCCHTDRCMHYRPATASKIINTCIILHNFALHHNLPLFFQDVPLGDGMIDVDPPVDNANPDTTRAGEAARRLLMNHLIRLRDQEDEL